MKILEMIGLSADFLRHTARYRPPPSLCATDHNLLGLFSHFSAHLTVYSPSPYYFSLSVRLLGQIVSESEGKQCPLLSP